MEIGCVFGWNIAMFTVCTIISIEWLLMRFFLQMKYPLPEGWTRQYMPQGVHLAQIVFVSASVFHDTQRMIRQLVVPNDILHVRLGASFSCPHNNPFLSALARAEQWSKQATEPSDSGV